tara:strand:+ start:3789 stop:5357 length:1569 start_codon:yes stop_codon:yes gene_type:complete
LTQVTISYDNIDNTYKFIHGDIVNDDNIVVTKSKWREQYIACILKLDNMHGKENGKLLYKCIPYNKTLPIFLVPYEEKIGFSKKRTSKYVLIQYKHWNNKHPICQLKQTFGNIDNLDYLYEYLLFALDIHVSNQRFTKEFISVYKKYTKHMHLQHICERYAIEDRSSREIYTIDGETTQDFDDAIGYIKNGSESIISIYISNPVLWFDYLDIWNSYGGRTSSIYLPERVVNMLPNMMGTKVASLCSGEYAIAFTMDILIQNNVVQNISYQNTMIKVTHNFIYEESKLLKNSLYKNILITLRNMGYTVKNSHECIEVLMIYFNSKIGEKMSQKNNGIYRYCDIIDSQDKKVPDELQEYMQWQDIQSGYSLYNPSLNHKKIGVSFYTQMSSPLRRIVDIINMIEFMINNKMCTLTGNTISYKDKWLMRLDSINNNHRAIKRLESETKLLQYYTTTTGIKDNVYEGYVVNIIEDYKYKIYLPHLQTTSVLKVIEEIPLYTKIKCKLCLLQDDINIVRKIRLIKLN